MCAEIDFSCNEILFDELPSYNVPLFAPSPDWIEQILRETAQWNFAPKQANTRRRTRHEIMHEIRTAFAAGKFETKRSNSEAYAVFSLFVRDKESTIERRFRMYSNGSVEYRRRKFKNPWDMLSLFKRNSQTWQRQVRHNGRTLHWYLRGCAK